MYGRASDGLEIYPRPESVPNDSHTKYGRAKDSFTSYSNLITPGFYGARATAPSIDDSG